MTEKCIICRAEDKLQTHHISYIPEMVITLCQKCHITVHGHGTGNGRVKIKKDKKPKIQKNNQAYEMCSVMIFCKNMVKSDIGGYVLKDSFYDAYLDYCKKFNLTVKKKIDVGRKIKMHTPYVKFHRLSTEPREYIYKGITLTNQNI